MVLTHVRFKTSFMQGSLHESLKILQTDSVHAVLPWQLIWAANKLTHYPVMIWLHLQRSKLSPANCSVSVKQCKKICVKWLSSFVLAEH